MSETPLKEVSLGVWNHQDDNPYSNEGTATYRKVWYR